MFSVGLGDIRSKRIFKHILKPCSSRTSGPELTAQGLFHIHDIDFTVKGSTRGAVKGALTGAGVGAKGGIPGAVAGTIIGGAIGYITGPAD